MDLRALLARLADRLGIKDSPVRALVIALAVAVLAGGTIAVVVDGDGDGQPDNTTTVHLPDPGPRAADALPAEVRADDPLAAAAGRVGMTVEEAWTAVEEGEPRKEAGDTDRAAKSFNVQRVQGFAGCRTRILSVNWSERSARAVWQVPHYAVIRNTPGWADLDLLFRIFANDARDASSHFGIDAEGHCIYMVPVDKKAWTSGGANSFSVSYEVIAFGDEAEYCPGPCLAKFRKVAQQVKNRTGIPIRRGAVSASNPCAPGRSGFVTHWEHASCGGSHHDIKPFSIDAFVAQLADDGQVLTEKELKWVKSARHPTGTGHSRRFWCGKIETRIRALADPAPGRDRDARRRILKRVARATC